MAFAATALTLNKLNVAGLDSASVIVTVIVSAFPLSSETKIDLTNPEVALGQV